MARTKNLSKLERAVEHRLDQLKRDILLEHDSVFTGNYRQLRENQARGIVTPQTAAQIEEWLKMSSLRRNHISVPEARRLMRA